MVLSSENISQLIANTPAPILFFDTCILLDILRSPYRENLSIDTISAALQLIALSENNPRKVWLLINETVQTEWNEHITDVQKELEREIERLEYTREKLVAAANIIFKIKHSHGEKIKSLNLHNHLRNLSNNLLLHCLIIKREDTHDKGAMHRVRKYLPPAKKGKSEPKDCEIFEAFLDISEKVRILGYDRNIYFVTSNSSDYGKPNNPLIIKDLNSINATLINNLQWALIEIKK